MSVTKCESLKSGKLNIIQVDNSPDIERQKDYNCIVNSTPTKNSNVTVNKNNDLIVNCTPIKTTNNNKNTESETDFTLLKNSISDSIASSGGGKEYCEKFFIPPDIRQIYEGFAQSRNKTEEIIEYFFDSCSSGEENYESSEIKSSDLLSDSNLYAKLLHLKKKTKTPWQNNFRKKTKKTSINDSGCSSAHCQNKTFVFSCNKESDFVHSEKSFTDKSQNLSEDRIVETPQLKKKSIKNKTKSNLKQLLLEQFCHIEKQNTVNDSENNFKILPEQITFAAEKYETVNSATPILENFNIDTENSSVTKTECNAKIHYVQHSSIFDIENNAVHENGGNFGTSVLEDFTCDTINYTVNESDNNINNQWLEISSSDKPISQNCIVNEEDGDFETLFLEKTTSINVKNCTSKKNICNINSQSPKLPFYDNVKNCCVEDNNSKEKISLYDGTDTELDHSDCNEVNMFKSKDRRNLEGVSSKTVESLKNTDNEISKSFSKLQKESDSSENEDSSILKHDKQYSLISSEPVKIDSRHSKNFSDIEQYNENKKSPADNNQNLNGTSPKSNSINQGNKCSNKERKNEYDKTDSYRNSSVEKDKQNIAAIIKYNRLKERRRSAYDTSKNSDSDTDKHSINKSIYSKNKDIVTNSDSENNCSDQEDSNHTITGYVKKLSSENDSEASDKRNTKTFKSLSFNRTVDRHVSVSSNDNNSDISDKEKRPVSTYKGMDSINRIKSNLLIDFNEDFLRRNEVWLVQCPKNMNMGNIKGQSLNVPSRTVVHDHGCKYECYAHQNNTLQQTVNLAIPHKLHAFTLNVVPIAGYVIFEEKVEVPEVTSIMINAKRKLPLPDHLKVRHPLLGLDYLDQPKTSVVQSNRNYKKKKKHKHRNSLPIDSNGSKIQIDSTPSMEKKRKSENNPPPISNVDESDSSLNYIFKSPKKNKRKRSVSTSSELANITENDATVNDFTPRSSKKKRKKSASETPFNDTNFEETEISSNETPRLKKRKKRKRMESETLFDGNFEETETEISNETPRLKKKKKRKRMESETLFDGSYEKSFVAFEDERPTKKKKKKSKSRNTSFEEEADDVQLDNEKSSSKKKKKSIEFAVGKIF